MKYITQILLFIFSIISCANLCAISIVYNFRIAQITKQPIFEDASERDNSIIALLFDQYQKKYNGTTQNFVGGLGAYIRNFGSNFFRTDFAISHIKEKTCLGSKFTDTETDDILFTLGHSFKTSNHSVLTLSGLFGIPTHKILRLKHVDFGYGQIGLGAQIDGSYTPSQAGSFLYGTRYIYYVPKNAHDTAHDKYRFTIGNTADILLSYNAKWAHHGLEVGFTERWQFGAHICPNLDDIVKKTNYTRSNFYAVYKYKFLVDNVAHRLLFNISYGFDNSHKPFSNKYIVTVWGSWNIRF